MISGFDSSVAILSQKLTITYESKTVEYNITISEPASPVIISIVLKSTTHKTEYIIGESLDVENLLIEATYNDGTKKEVDVVSGMVTGFDSSAAVLSQTVTITYEGMTAVYNVTIKKAEVVSIVVVSKNHAKLYYVGGELDVRNLYIEATYNNGVKRQVLVTKDMVSGFDSSAAVSSQTLTISYENKMTTYDIVIIMPKVLYISVKSNNHKTQFWVNDELDVNNLVIEVTYSNNIKENINVTTNMVTGFDSSAPILSQSLTITYKDVTTSYNITIKEVVLSSIEIKSTTHKIIYTVGEALDVSNLVLEAKYSNGSQKDVIVTESMIVGFDSSVFRTGQTLTITYQNKQTEYYVAIRTENSYILTNIISEDLNGQPYQDPLVQVKFEYYAGSFIELRADNTYSQLAIIRSPSINSWVGLSGAYKVEGDTLTLTPSFGNDVTATFIDGRIIMKELMMGSIIGGTKSPDYYVSYIYEQV